MELGFDPRGAEDRGHEGTEYFQKCGQPTTGSQSGPCSPKEPITWAGGAGAIEMTMNIEHAQTYNQNTSEDSACLKFGCCRRLSSSSVVARPSYSSSVTQSGVEDYIQNHSACNLYERTGIDADMLSILVSAEEEAQEQLRDHALPLAQEWFGHFAVRDQMQDSLEDSKLRPKKGRTYLAADYQEPECAHHVPTYPPTRNLKAAAPKMKV